MDKDNHNKSEFEWEREFRRIDARLAACMAEIPSVLDLPGEEELLKRRLAKKRPEFASGKWELPKPIDAAEFDDLGFPDDWRKREGADIYIAAETLCGNWARGMSVALPVSSRGVAIEILCRHGKILGYAVDLIDSSREEDAGIQIALCKRLVDEIETILATLDHETIPKRVVERHHLSLRELRQKTLDLLFKKKRGDVE